MAADLDTVAMVADSDTVATAAMVDSDMDLDIRSWAALDSVLDTDSFPRCFMAGTVAMAGTADTVGMAGMVDTAVDMAATAGMAATVDMVATAAGTDTQGTRTDTPTVRTVMGSAPMDNSLYGRTRCMAALSMGQRLFPSL